MRETADYERRIDSLLDELTATKALLNACLETESSETQSALEICVSANVELAAKLMVMQRFISACKQTDYRPEPWELELILATPQGRSL